MTESATIQQETRRADLGPTANLLAAYLKAMTKASLEPLCIMLAMQMRPLSSWSATFRNLSRGLEILEWKVPSRSTVELAFSKPWRGIRTSASGIHASHSQQGAQSYRHATCMCLWECRAHVQTQRVCVRACVGLCLSEEGQHPL